MPTSPGPPPVPMLDTFKSVASLLLSYALLIVANALFNTLLGVRMELEGFGANITGLVMGAYFLGLLVGARSVNRIIARVGHIRSFAAFASVVSITALIHVLWVTPLVWAAMRIAAGFCMAGMITITESWLNSRADNQHRGQVLSWYMITNFAAAGCGQFLLPLADPGEFVLFSLISIIFSLSLIPVLLTRSSAPTPAPPAAVSLGYLYQIAPAALIGALAAGIINASFYSLAPVFAQRIGLSLHQTSVFMASVVLSGIVLQWPIGRLSDRFGRTRVLAAVSGGTTIACVVIVIASRQPGMLLFATAAAYGSMVFTLYSLAAAQANDRSRPEDMVQTAGALLIAYGIGAIAGPVLSGLAMRWIGPQGLFLLNGASALLLTVYALSPLARSLPGESGAPYVPKPGTQFSSEILYRDVRDTLDRELRKLGGQPGRKF